MVLSGTPTNTELVEGLQKLEAEACQLRDKVQSLDLEQEAFQGVQLSEKELQQKKAKVKKYYAAYQKRTKLVSSSEQF